METTDGSVVQDFPPRVRQKAKIAPENLALVNEALFAVVNDPKGTAYPVRDASLEIAGKTGTAQTGYVNTGGDDPKKAWYLARDHAWFASYWPAKAPEIAVVVLVEHGGSGPTVAAPLAIQIIREYHRIAQSRLKPVAKGARPDPKTAEPPPAAKAAPHVPPVGPDGLPEVPDPLAAPPSGRPEDPPDPPPDPSGAP